MSYVHYGEDKRYLKYIPQIIQFYDEVSLDVCIYTSKTRVIESILNGLDRTIDVHIVNIDKEFDFKYIKLLRFQTHLTYKYDYYLSRDLDSIPTLREFNLIKSWLSTGSGCCIIRDHPDHTDAIMAGLFAYTSNAIHAFPNLNIYKLQIEKAHKQSMYRYDQIFLSKCIYPKIVNQAAVYTSCNYFTSEKPITISKPLPDEIVMGWSDKTNVVYKSYKINYPVYILFGCRPFFKTICDTLKKLVSYL